MNTGNLIEQNWSYWNHCYQHPFLENMVCGNLKDNEWQWYLQENIAYLQGLAEVFASFLPYCKREKERNYCRKMLASIMEDAYARKWQKKHGIVCDYLRMHASTQAYIEFYQAIAATRDFKKLLCALMPCTLSYAWIAEKLLDRAHDHRAHLWLKEFQTERYLAFCEESRSLLDDYMKRCTYEEYNELLQIFKAGCQHEETFWNLAYTISEKEEIHMFETYMRQVENIKPLVHCITNYVTVNDCANIVLAAKGSPIMADDAQEVEEITSLCHALVINIGTLNERTIPSMIKAGKKANALHHPVILDPVGAGASKLRSDSVHRILDEVHVDIIRGNISELKTIYEGSGMRKGVDADEQDSIHEENIMDGIAFAQTLAAAYDCVIAITGAIDIVCNATSAYIIRNGHPAMAYITGTGCMLSALCAVYAGANNEHLLEACATAVAMMGYAGEIGAAKMKALATGTASLRTYIIDAIYRMDAKTMKEGAKLVRFEK